MTNFTSRATYFSRFHFRFHPPALRFPLALCLCEHGTYDKEGIKCCLCGPGKTRSLLVIHSVLLHYHFSQTKFECCGIHLGCKVEIVKEMWVLRLHQLRATGLTCPVMDSNSSQVLHSQVVMEN